MDTYYALIADLDASRSYEYGERRHVQRLLTDVVTFLNCLHDSGLEIPVAFSAGDEVQGLFSDFGSAFLFFRELSIFMYPHRLHAGIGAGGWEVRAEGGPSPAQDGTAYHYARAAIEAAESDRIYRLMVHDGSARLQESVLAGYSLGICASRGRRQGEVARLVELCRPLVAGSAWESSSRCNGELSSARLKLLEAFVDNEYLRPLVGKGQEPAFPEGAVVDTHVSSVIQEGRAHTDQNMRGLSYKLESLAGASRTSIDRTIDSGRVLQERDAATLMVLSCAGRI